MSEEAQTILLKALDLPPIERAELVEQILASFEFRADQRVDALWAQEAEERIEAHKKGQIKATPAQAVFEKIDKQSE